MDLLPRPESVRQREHWGGGVQVDVPAVQPVADADSQTPPDSSPRLAALARRRSLLTRNRGEVEGERSLLQDPALSDSPYCLCAPGQVDTRWQVPERLMVFIDGSNLFYASLQLGFEIDYQRLLTCLTGRRQLIRAYFYTGVDRSNDKQMGFLLWLRRHGYRLILKDLQALPDGSRKANLDVEIAVDMMNLADHCNTLVLLTGDGDLAYAVKSVTARGARVEVVGLRSMTSEDLIDVADRYTDLASLKPGIFKVPLT